MNAIVIAIDGPAASGKSSTAADVAKQLGFYHVDSGALYRALTAAALGAEPDVAEWTEASLRGQTARIGLVQDGVRCFVTIDGREAGRRIRTPEVTQHVSHVAARPSVRAWVNKEVRSATRRGDLVVDGRDIGTEVFPDAQLKVYLVADALERARRRLVQRGSAPGDAELAAEAARLVERDARDAKQTVPAKDAVVLDTTHMTQAEQVARIVELARDITRGENATSAG